MTQQKNDNRTTIRMKLLQNFSDSSISQVSSKLLSILTIDDADDYVKYVMTPQSTTRHLAVSFGVQDAKTDHQVLPSVPRPVRKRRLSFEERKRSLPRHNVAEDLTKSRAKIMRTDPLSSSLKMRKQTNTTANNQDLIDLALGQNCLTGDGQSAFCLPTVEGKHHDLNSISPDTLSDLLNGAYDHVINSYRIIDCRYPYEFEGGHIKDAENIYTEEGILDLLHSSRAIKGQHNILIFHCEFSSERGPKKCRFLRNMDRKLNADNYPFLHFPEVYLLHGGYKEFYTQNKRLCVPQTYTPMLEKGRLEDLRHFRKKSQSWTAGEKRRHARRTFRI